MWWTNCWWHTSKRWRIAQRKLIFHQIKTTKIDFLACLSRQCSLKRSLMSKRCFCRSRTPLGFSIKPWRWPTIFTSLLKKIRWARSTQASTTSFARKAKGCSRSSAKEWQRPMWKLRSSILSTWKTRMKRRKLWKKSNHLRLESRFSARQWKAVIFL